MQLLPLGRLGNALRLAIAGMEPFQTDEVTLLYPIITPR